MERQQKKKSNPLVESCAGIGVYIAFAVSFGVLTNDESYYAPCGTDSSSYQWSYITYVFYVITCILAGVVVPILGCLLIKSIENQSSSVIILSTILNIIRLGMGVMGLVCFGGLCHSYGEEENCGQLNDLILAYIIIGSIGLGFACCGIAIALCCGAALGGAALAGLKGGGLQKQLEAMQKQMEADLQKQNANANSQPEDNQHHIAIEAPKQEIENLA